jgi:hypothetical protein
VEEVGAAEEEEEVSLLGMSSFVTFADKTT